MPWFLKVQPCTGISIHLDPSFLYMCTVRCMYVDTKVSEKVDSVVAGIRDTR